MAFPPLVLEGVWTGVLAGVFSYKVDDPDRLDPDS